MIVLAVTNTACTNKEDFEKGKRQLENMGYSNVRDTGYDAFCCSDKDTYSTGFTCTDKEGRTVKGCICSAWLKGVKPYTSIKMAHQSTRYIVLMRVN